MQKLIIVCGLPGSGKTTLARELSRKLGIVCLHKDSIKEKIFEGLKLKTLEDSKRIGKPSIDVMMYLAQEQIANGIDIIIEAPFNFSEDYDIFLEWRNKYNLELYSVICTVEATKRKERFDNRQRHHAHFDNLRTVDHFAQNEYDYATIPGKQIRLDTNAPVSELVNSVISQIK